MKPNHLKKVVTRLDQSRKWERINAFVDGLIIGLIIVAMMIV